MPAVCKVRRGMYSLTKQVAGRAMRLGSPGAGVRQAVSSDVDPGRTYDDTGLWDGVL